MGHRGVLSELPPHEKVRFRRGDMACLDELPSAIPRKPVSPASFQMGRRAARTLLAVAFGCVALVALGLGAVVSGIGDERLRLEAQSALAALGGEAFSSRIGDANISFDGIAALALEAEDVRVAATGADDILHIGSVRLGLRVLPLATGDLRIDRLTISDATVHLAALPGSGERLELPFLDEAGFVDPDAALAFVFASAKRVMEELKTRDVNRIALRNIDIFAAGGETAHTVRIVRAVLRRAADGQLSLTAELESGGRNATVDGTAELDASGEIVRALAVRLDAPSTDEGQEISGFAGRFKSASATLGGSQGVGGDRFTLSAQVTGAELPISRQGFTADFFVDATALAGTNKLEIDRLRVASGRSGWNFHGAIGPEQRGEGVDAEKVYRFELVSDGSTIAPAGSPEPAATVFARIAGHADAVARRIDVEEIAARTRPGEISGRAVVHLERGKSPGIDLSLAGEGIQVSQAKQLWPWYSAPSARNWVLANVFGGQVREGRIDFSVPPGRLGDGVPLRRGEVSGKFMISGTRFDVAGRLPPVRDAVGEVSFDGTDVDISLASGTAYMSQGRTVDAAHGVLTIRDAHIRPVIGKLEIGISGKADAVMELASYDPIDVGRFIDLKPEELSGNMSGQVRADIPLNRGIPLDSLDWRVALDYDELAVSRLIEGQTISDASGSIVVNPAQAVIDATARLNGSPANLHLVEPLGKDKTARRRDVEIRLDDKARQALAPGLDTILSGNAAVKLDATATGKRRIDVSLDNASLNLPWVGWSKGSGVPASASFLMEGEGGTVSLSDFRLQGESFGASGEITLANGALQRLRFPSARLGRGDDFSVDVTAKGRGYDIKVRGRSIDARSLVKLHTSESGGGAGAATDAGTVNLDVQVDAMSGFHGEMLRNVRLNYSGVGGRTQRLEFSAVTASGRPVAYVDARQDDLRRIDMNSTDAGALLRFMDLYEYMHGGEIALSLAGRGDAPMSGQVDARDFWIVDEPRLASLVSTPPQGDSRSLNQAVRANIDTQRVQFERGFSRVVKAAGSLTLDGGILRGPLIGMSFQGTLYDAQGNIAMTGTFMPAYGLNRIFGEIPIIGQILGNGRDRGLIGITFRLIGRKDNPHLDINPLSVIAPGIFRSVFEFR